MAGWWPRKAGGKTFFYKMHKHLKYYNKSTGEMREIENMVNSEKVRREFRHKAMLQWFLNHFHIFIMSAWRISITALGKWKINTSTVSATAVASTFLASMSSGMVVNIEQTPPMPHPEQPSAENFLYFSG